MTFTVVIPTCRRPEMLARCLRALPGDAHIVVSDDSADDTTRLLVEREFPCVHWVRGPRRGPAANRNHGARAASGEWIAFIDDDCEPQPGWLAAMARATANADVVEGRTLAPGATDSPFEEHVENLHGGTLWSCNLAVRREAFERLGGFDEEFLEAGGEDMEFAWRVAHRGLRVSFASDALAHHPPRRIGWRGLWRRTWMIRWFRLYQIKTGQKRPLPVAASPGGDGVAARDHSPFHARRSRAARPAMVRCRLALAYVSTRPAVFALLGLAIWPERAAPCPLTDDNPGGGGGGGAFCEFGVGGGGDRTAHALARLRAPRGRSGGRRGGRDLSVRAFRFPWGWAGWGWWGGRPGGGGMSEAPAL